MGLDKQSVTFNFISGIDTLGDPNQLSIGKFVTLKNSEFIQNDGVGRLNKRNGYGTLTSLPDSTSYCITTFNTNLVALGNDIKAYSFANNAWRSKGLLTTCQLSVIPVVRNNLNQTRLDASVSNGLVCIAYTENQSIGSSTILPIQKYAVYDSSTGQNFIAPTQIKSTNGTVSQFSRVYSLGNNFVVVFPSFGSGGGTNKLQYFSISQSSSFAVGAVTDITSTYVPNIQTIGSMTNWDGVVASS